MNNPAPFVYVIDDDASVRQAIASLMRSVGLRVKTFGTSAEFLQSQRTDAPSCLILDVKLPETNGLDFQRELTEAKIEIPIIFISGHGDIPMSVRAMKAGAVEFFTKPFRDQELLDAIQIGLERDRARRVRNIPISRMKSSGRAWSQARCSCKARAGSPATRLPGLNLRSFG